MPQFNYRNATVWYAVEGSGFPVVLIHGFAEDGDVWKHQVAVLKNYCKVIVPDLPGSGQSTILLPEEGKDISIADYADCIDALLAHQNIASCAVFGHSMGGYITLSLVEKCKSKIAGFGFVHSTAFADSEEKKMARAKGIKTIGEYGSYAFIKSTTPNLFAEAYKTSHGEDIAALIERGKSFSNEALQQYYKAMMMREDKTDVLRSSLVPVLFIIGKDDKAAPMADLLQQVHLPSVAYISIIEEVGHMGMWEKRDEVNRSLFSFIQDVEK